MTPSVKVLLSGELKIGVFVVVVGGAWDTVEFEESPESGVVAEEESVVDEPEDVVKFEVTVEGSEVVDGE